MKIINKKIKILNNKIYNKIVRIKIKKITKIKIILSKNKMS